mmetsp:Transcript_22171/g.53055  ORF Transcript_22171/g.53055 Transcript_22171/m.53055 type:complete len:225 (-) Transcript_22171:9-683(-)
MSKAGRRCLQQQLRASCGRKRSIPSRSPPFSAAAPAKPLRRSASGVGKLSSSETEFCGLFACPRHLLPAGSHRSIDLSLRPVWLSPPSVFRTASRPPRVSCRGPFGPPLEKVRDVLESDPWQRSSRRLSAKKGEPRLNQGDSAGLSTRAPLDQKSPSVNGPPHPTRKERFVMGASVSLSSRKEEGRHPNFAGSARSRTDRRHRGGGAEEGDGPRPFVSGTRNHT